MGHSGDSPQIPFVDFGAPPQTRKERLAVLQKMVAHSQFCWSGDHTVEAAEAAVTSVREGSDYGGGGGGGGGDFDDGFGGAGQRPRHFVFLLSDANLRRYGIDARDLGRELTRDPAVQGHFVMIASLADEAHRALQVSHCPYMPVYLYLTTQTPQGSHCFSDITSSTLRSPAPPCFMFCSLRAGCVCA